MSVDFRQENKILTKSEIVHKDEWSVLSRNNEGVIYDFY